MRLGHWLAVVLAGSIEVVNTAPGNTLLTVFMIGLAVANLVFRTIERRTVRRWELQSQRPFPRITKPSASPARRPAA